MQDTLQFTWKESQGDNLQKKATSLRSKRIWKQLQTSRRLRPYFFRLSVQKVVISLMKDEESPKNPEEKNLYFVEIKGFKTLNQVLNMFNVIKPVENAGNKVIPLVSM